MQRLLGRMQICSCVPGQCSAGRDLSRRSRRQTSSRSWSCWHGDSTKRLEMHTSVLTEFQRSRCCPRRTARSGIWPPHDRRLQRTWHLVLPAIMFTIKITIQYVMPTRCVWGPCREQKTSCSPSAYALKLSPAVWAHVTWNGVKHISRAHC